MRSGEKKTFAGRRRLCRFLKGFLILICIASIPAANGCRAPLMPKPLSDMQQKDFERCIDDIFVAAPEAGQEIPLTLVSVTGKKRENMVSFSLEFIGPTDSVFQPETVTVTHDKLGSFPLFLSPFKRDEQGVHYFSIFTRLPQD